MSGWAPPTEAPTWFDPVGPEDALKGITACSLPDSRAVAVWPVGSEIHFAVLDNMQALLGDDVITAPMIETALTAAGEVYRATVFTVESQVYFVVLGDTAVPGDRFWLRIYRADDPLNPSGGWSLHGTVHSGTNYDFIDFGGALNSGVPLILDSGRAVISATKAYRETFGAGGFVGRDAGFWYSDDGMVTWVHAASFYHGTPAHHAHYSAPQIIQHPTTGDLLSGAVLDGNFTDTVVSDDEGETWAHAGYTGGDTKVFSPFVAAGEEVYGIRSDGNGDIHHLVGTDWGTSVVQVWTGPGAWPTVSGDGSTAKFLVDNDAMYFFAGRYVTGGNRGWQHGSTAFG
jgi:hypothetical protein